MSGILGAALAVSLLWGSGWLFMKLGVSSFPPFLFAGVRGVLAGLFLLALARLQDRTWPLRRHLLPTIAIGVLMTGVSNGFVFWGQALISSSLAALVWCSMPFFTAILSHILLPDQKLNLLRLSGLVLGFSGVWLVLGTQHLELGAGSTGGKLAIIIGAVLWALALVLNKKGPSIDAVVMTGVQLLAGGAFLVPLSLLSESYAAMQVTPVSVGVFLMMLFGQGILAYFCYYYLLSKVSATSVSMLSFITPSIAVVLGVLLLGEPLYWQMGAGLVLVAAGIIIVNMIGQREQVAA